MGANAIRGGTALDAQPTVGGFYVAYKVDSAALRVFFKSWELGDDEPAWEDQEYST